MTKTKKIVSNILKGIVIGIGTLIPGVSGGTAAIAVGEFENIMESVANIFSDFAKSFTYLLQIFSGAMIGVAIITKPLELFCLYAPTLSKHTFCIFSLISCFFFIKKTLEPKLNKGKLISLLLGIVCAVALIVTSEGCILNICTNIVSIFIIGIFLSVALMLPAISFSYMLLFFGIYEKTLWAIINFDLLYIFPLILGILIGSLIFSKVFVKLIKKHHQETYSFVLGFVLCSVAQILA